MAKLCIGCGSVIPESAFPTRKFCVGCPNKRCRAPAVYRFICPDGRSYIGITRNHHVRPRYGVARRNARLDEAFANHPPETWTYELIEVLPQGSSREAMQEAEQRHIDNFGSQRPECGFNVARSHVRRWK